MNNITKIIKDYNTIGIQKEIDVTFPHIRFLINKIENKILNLKNKKLKTKRSINWIGSAWKWIAGTPDHHDMEIIDHHINKILKNNNRQVIINSQFCDKINQLIKSFNQLLKNGKHNVVKIPENIILKLQYMDEELTNIAYAIHWAKENIINPQLLSREEMEAILTQLDKNNFPYSTVEEAFNIATIKLATNDVNILYIIEIPMVYTQSYDVLTLRTNGLSKPIINLQHNKILYTHELMYGVISSCKLINNIQLCRREDLIDITNTSCIPNIMKGTHATCNEIKKSSTSTVELLNDGMLLLNTFNGNVIQTCSDINYNLNGTFLLRFNNCSININNQFFISKEISINKTMPQTFVTAWTSINSKDLTLQQIEKLHINNLDKIEIMQTKVKIHFWNSITVYGIIIFIIIIFLYLKCKKQKTITLVNNIQSKEETPIPLAASIYPIPNTPQQEDYKLTGKRI